MKWTDNMQLVNYYGTGIFLLFSETRNDSMNISSDCGIVHFLELLVVILGPEQVITTTMPHRLSTNHLCLLLKTRLI